MEVYFKKLDPKAKLPESQYNTDAGYDICACLEHPVIIGPGQRMLIGTGLAAYLPKNTFVMYGGIGWDAVEPWVWTIEVRSRSGLASKYGICVLNSPGTVDSDYHGELKIILYNAGDKDYVVDPGDRIAQLVFVKAYRPTITEITEVPQDKDDNRGAKGFGSTGIGSKNASLN